MQQNTKKILESFKNLNWKRQSAFLDILNDLLLLIKPIKKDKNTFEKVMFDKVLKDSDMIPKFDENMPDEEKANKLSELIQIYNWFVKSYSSFTKWRWVSLFVYNKEKDKLIKEISEEYWYIDNKTLKNIYTDRWIFIATLEELWFIEKIDTDKEISNFIKLLKKNKVIEQDYNFDDLKENTKWFLDFSNDNAMFLSKDKAKDEYYVKYIESISLFFPYSDIIWEANEEMKDLKLSLYFFDIKKLKNLDSLLSFETNLKKRETFFKFENSELNINWFKIHNPDLNTKIENILKLIYEWALEDKSLDFIKIDTVKTILRENLNDYKYYKSLFLTDHYFETHTNMNNKQAKEDLYNDIIRLIDKNITTKLFDDSLKDLNKKIFNKIEWVNGKFFRMTKNWMEIQYI